MQRGCRAGTYEKGGWRKKRAGRTVGGVGWAWCAEKAQEEETTAGRAGEQAQAAMLYRLRGNA
jgi:hypothetical protein